MSHDPIAERIAQLEETVNQIDEASRASSGRTRTELLATMAATIAAGLMDRYSLNDLWIEETWVDDEKPNDKGRDKFAADAVDIARRILAEVEK